MENITDMILKSESSSKISDAIKDILNMKALEKIDNEYPNVASNLFDVDEEE